MLTKIDETIFIDIDDINCVLVEPCIPGKPDSKWQVCTFRRNCSYTDMQKEFETKAEAQAFAETHFKSIGVSFEPSGK